MTYQILIDGESIGEITLPKMSQDERDQIRKEIAKEYQVPVHYLRLSPKVRGI